MTKPRDELFVYTPDGTDYAGRERDIARAKDEQDEKTHAERLRELQRDDGQHQWYRK